jgi:hypothetical protein
MPTRLNACSADSLQIVVGGKAYKVMKTIGHYLGRDVCLLDASDLGNVSRRSLRDAVVLAVNEREWEVQHRDLISSLIDLEPQSIVLWGKNATLAFDLLISILSRPEVETGLHIMTNFLDDEELEAAVGSFLRSTWPTEDRFDDWTRYVILSIDGMEQGTVEAAVSRRVDKI